MLVIVIFEIPFLIKLAIKTLALPKLSAKRRKVCLQICLP